MIIKVALLPQSYSNAARKLFLKAYKVRGKGFKGDKVEELMHRARILRRAADERKLGLFPKMTIKKAFFSWGGRGHEYGSGKSNTQLSLGYSNFLGLLPYPYAGVRFGERNKPGLTVGIPAYIGYSGRARDSLRERSGIPGLLDVIINSIEDINKKHKVKVNK